MANVHDVAAYILNKAGPMTAMKLQKLVYYSQAWSLVWDEKPLFPEPIQAWVNGPVVPDLYELHRGRFELENWPKGDPSALNGEQQATIDAVLKFYGDKTSQWLSDLTHKEAPWINARHDLAPTERGSAEIQISDMMEYYSGL